MSRWDYEKPLAFRAVVEVVKLVPPERVQQRTVKLFVAAPAPAVFYALPDPFVKYVEPALAMTHASPPVSALTCVTPAPVIDSDIQSPQVQEQVFRGNEVCPWASAAAHSGTDR